MQWLPLADIAKRAFGPFRALCSSAGRKASAMSEAMPYFASFSISLSTKLAGTSS